MEKKEKEEKKDKVEKKEERALRRLRGKGVESGRKQEKVRKYIKKNEEVKYCKIILLHE